MFNELSSFEMELWMFSTGFKSSFKFAEVLKLWGQFKSAVKAQADSNITLDKYMKVARLNRESIVVELECYELEEHDGKIYIIYPEEPSIHYCTALLAEFIATVIADNDEMTMEFIGQGICKYGYNIRKGIVCDLSMALVNTKVPKSRFLLEQK